MKEEIVRNGGTIALIRHWNEPADPQPTPINGKQLTGIGYVCKGSTYTGAGPKIVYDGCNWFMEGVGRVKYFEEVKKILGI